MVTVHLSVVCYLLAVVSVTCGPVEEENPEFWRSLAQSTLRSALARRQNTNVAKNIVLFLGDGMGVTTITAARILKGQMENRTGEETVMNMDTFPYVGLAKVYSVDFQIPDSASTGTAYLCGVKTNLNTVGVNAAARNGVCRSQKGNEVTSILKWAKDAGKSVGIVTTTRVQHATPAASYAHSASRTWYSDADLPLSAVNEGCVDIAVQLITNTDIDVIIGGGRKYMTPKGDPDPEYPTDVSSQGQRKDKRNLINEWLGMKQEKVARFVWNKTDFDAVDPEKTDYLMALFEPGDLRYDVERDSRMDPSIIETTEKAIKILQKNPNGFFLLVEGKSPVFGLDFLPYTTLMYGNGPGHKIQNNKRPDIRKVDTTHKDYVQQSAAPLDTETHGGEDVALFAHGPMAHLFQGVYEQNYIAHAMAYAACIGANQQHCTPVLPTNTDPGSAAPDTPLWSMMSLLLSMMTAVLLY
ncbi:alkaline phosphatase, tissue-nonspecific isozyme isoform X2 [Misgurnus anguillicaudatus]|uniref:alkaline phosphatase, tissue-nonspecific isozyme isoform X2 n=1 Tax=Misgurnus anguillicaudatus TaxID=75329 RepID=UPI003CCF905D